MSSSFVQSGAVLKDSAGFLPCRPPFKKKLASRMCVVCFKPRRRLLSHFALAQWCGSRVRAVLFELKVLRGLKWIYRGTGSLLGSAHTGRMKHGDGSKTNRLKNCDTEYTHAASTGLRQPSSKEGAGKRVLGCDLHPISLSLIAYLCGRYMISVCSRVVLICVYSIARIG